jgi:hypothetical protein
MTPKLTTEQRQAIDQQQGAPVYVVDDATSEQWVLAPAHTFQKFKSLLSEDVINIRDVYAAQEQVAASEGWDDPAMDDYNDYDAKRNAHS